MLEENRSIPLYSLLALLLISLMGFVPAKAESEGFEIYRDKKILLGIGTALVRMDSNIRITDKDSGNHLFLDLEGTLGLPSKSNVTNYYGGYRFNEKHSIGLSHFGINRSSHLIDFEGNLGDIGLVKADVTLTDKTEFTKVFYGYSMFHDNRSAVRFLGGLFLLDLKYEFEAEGEKTNDGVTSTNLTYNKRVSQIAPLPMFGFDFNHYFTPRWSLDTAVLVVGGTYQDVTAGVLQSTIRATYHATKHVGLDMGISYFDADVTIDKSDEKQEVNYGYDGISLGIHVKL